MLTPSFHLQGDLQTVFDTLFDMGIIDPVLKMDWQPMLKEIEKGSEVLTNVVSIVNDCQGNRELLRSRLQQIDSYSLEILAMEVAREYASFHSREAALH